LPLQSPTKTADSIMPETLIMPDFLPRRDADLLNWSRNFDQRINSSYEQYGISAQQATDYSPLHAAAAAYETWQRPDTRTPGARAAKDQAVAALKAQARRLVVFIRATPDVSDTLMIDAGLRPRKRTMTPTPRPDRAPFIRVRGVRAGVDDHTAPERRLLADAARATARRLLRGHLCIRRRAYTGGSGKVAIRGREVAGDVPGGDAGQHTRRGEGVDHRELVQPPRTARPQRYAGLDVHRRRCHAALGPFAGGVSCCDT
jgi:hypothetical protein